METPIKKKLPANKTVFYYLVEQGVTMGKAGIICGTFKSALELKRFTVKELRDMSEEEFNYAFTRLTKLLNQFTQIKLVNILNKIHTDYELIE